MQGTTALMSAARQGSVPGVRLLLRAGADPERRDAGGWTALKIAAARGSLPVVRALLDAGATPCGEDGEGRRRGGAGARAETESARRREAAWAAAAACVAEMAIEDAAKAAVAELERAAPAAPAAAPPAPAPHPPQPPPSPRRASGAGGEDAPLAIVRLLLSATTPLMLAAGRGHAPAVSLLLRHRADPAARDEDGDTPLLLALKARPRPRALSARAEVQLEQAGAPRDAAVRDIARLLLSSPGSGRGGGPGELLWGHGADPALADCEGFLPLHNAAGNLRPCAQLLPASGPALQARAAAAGAEGEGGEAAWAIVRDLIEAGSPIDTPAGAETGSWPHATPLIMAASRSHAPAVALLLARGASVRAADADGDTALHGACAGSSSAALASPAQARAAELLLAAGADPALPNTQGLTPLHFACHSDAVALCRRLLAAGAPLAAPDHHARPSLLLADPSAWLPLLHAAQAAGQDVRPLANARSASGWAPLDVAALLPVLVPSAAPEPVEEAASPSQSGETALLLVAKVAAAAEGAPPAALVRSAGALLAVGADPNARRPDGLTALHCAAANGHADLCALLISAGADPAAPDARGRPAPPRPSPLRSSPNRTLLGRRAGAPSPSAPTTRRGSRRAGLAPAPPRRLR
eukprot:tig00001056_g6633.t1